jgi:hypothetical protein
MQAATGLDANMIKSLVAGDSMRLSEYAGQIAMQMPGGEGNISKALSLGMQQMALQQLPNVDGVEVQMHESGDVRFLIREGGEGPARPMSRDEATVMIAQGGVGQAAPGAIPAGRPMPQPQGALPGPIGP